MVESAFFLSLYWIALIFYAAVKLFVHVTKLISCKEMHAGIYHFKQACWQVLISVICYLLMHPLTNVLEQAIVLQDLNK